MTRPVTVAYGPEHAGCPVRLYTSLAGEVAASLPVAVENAEKWSLSTEEFALIGNGFLDERGRITFQVEEQEEQQKFQAIVQMAGGWRLSNLIETDAPAPPPAQTVTVQFDGDSLVTPGDTPGDVSIPVSIITSDGEVLEAGVSVDVRDLGTGSANTPTQYTMSTPQTLEFPIGSASGSQQVAILTNTGINGATGTVDLDLDNPDGATLGAQSTYTVTIVNIGA